MVFLWDDDYVWVQKLYKKIKLFFTKGILMSLEIIVQGKMNRYYLGSLSDELKQEIEKIKTNLNIGSTVKEALENLVFNDINELLRGFEAQDLSENYPILAESKESGSILDQLNIFFNPIAIEGDNDIEVIFDESSKFKGKVFELFENKKEYEEGDPIDTEKIRQHTFVNDLIQHTWGEGIEAEDKQLFLDSLEMNGASFSKNGWWIGDDIIINQTYESKLEDVDYEKRLSLVEYGNLSVIYKLADIKDFDLQSLIWNFDYGLFEERDNYFFSNVFMAAEGKIYKLNETVESLNQKQIIVDDDWPIDG